MGALIYRRGHPKCDRTPFSANRLDPGDGISWVCFHCWFTLGASTIPRSAALRKLQGHLAAGHTEQTDSSAERNLEDHDDGEELEDDGEEGDEDESEIDDADVGSIPT